MGPNFTVHNVLFIPQLKCDLISLGQLMEETDYFITFSNSLCVIQDPISRMPIGVGKRNDRVFINRPLQLSSLFVGSTTSIDSNTLWHLHLGHQSNFVIKSLLERSSPVKLGSNNICSVSLRAKQPRDVLPLSQNNAIELFDLIHCDF